jgi:hypothetical protein
MGCSIKTTRGYLIWSIHLHIAGYNSTLLPQTAIKVMLIIRKRNKGGKCR